MLKVLYIVWAYEWLLDYSVPLLDSARTKLHTRAAVNFMQSTQYFATTNEFPLTTYASAESHMLGMSIITVYFFNDVLYTIINAFESSHWAFPSASLSAHIQRSCLMLSSFYCV